MGMFKDMLSADQTLFRNTVALDYDFIPKVIPYREQEQRIIANCIKPLFQSANGRNLLIYGPPGIGKTVACKHLVNELEEETEEIIPLYINCWQKNSSYKILMEICDLLGYKFTHNKKTDELFNIVKSMINKKSAVFIFDEADKVEDTDFLYFILEEIYKKTIILITNHKELVLDFDDRIKSRLMAQLLEFRAYDLKETTGIMKERLDSAFYEGVWEAEPFSIATKKAYDMKDIRTGLFLLKEAGHAAEDESSKNITETHMQTALKKLDEFTIKKKTSLEDDTQTILDLIKGNSGKKIGELFDTYVKEGGKGVYKTFQRKIKHLADNKFISLEKSGGGSEGNTTIVTFSGNKTLNDFGK
ncbi:MAG: Cdc6/Cdc18 family protein [Candidatus Woesearchaeota archaeon]